MDRVLWKSFWVQEAGGLRDISGSNVKINLGNLTTCGPELTKQFEQCNDLHIRYFQHEI